MPPLPINGTPRLFIEYTSEGQEHVMVVRLAASAGDAEAQAMYNAVTNALKASMHTSDSFTGARFADDGSNLSFPLNVAAVVGTNTGTIVAGSEPRFASLTGRDTLGRRVRATFFSPFFSANEAYRAPASGNAPIAAWRTALISTGTGARTVGGLVPVWNTYFNVGVNAYFQRKQRRTG